METARHFADEISQLVKTAFPLPEQEVIREARWKDFFQIGMTKLLSHSRMKDYEDAHPNCSMQDIVDHLALHDPHDVTLMKRRGLLGGTE